MIYIPWVVFGLGLFYLIRVGFKEKREQALQVQRRLNLAASAMGKHSAAQAMNPKEKRASEPGLGQVPYTN
jgi:hypothetical protein